MPYKEDPSVTLQRLQRTLTSKLRTVEQLQEERSKLEYKHAILTSTCEVLSLIRRSKAVGDVHSKAMDCRICPDALATEHELQLLQQLHQSGSDTCRASDVQHEQLCAHHALAYALGAEAADIKQLCCSGRQDAAVAIKLEGSPSCSSDSNGPCSKPPAVSKPDEAKVSSISPPALNYTITPPTEPLSHIKDLLLQPDPQHLLASPLTPVQHTTLPKPSLMTLQHLQKHYRGFVKQLAAHVAAIEAAGEGNSASGCPAAPDEAVAEHLAAIKQEFQKSWWLMANLISEGRGDLAVTFYLTNAETGDRAHHTTELYSYVLQRMQFTQQQQDRVLAGLDFYMHSVIPVIQQRMALLDEQQQQQQRRQQQYEEWHNAGSTPDSSSDSSCSSSDSEAASPFRRQTAVRKVQEQQQQQWQEEQEHLDRLGLCLGKEVLLAYITCCAIHGALTWYQAAKLEIACYPYPASPIIFARVVKQQADLSKEQRRQQDIQQQRQQQRRYRARGRPRKTVK